VTIAILMPYRSDGGRRAQLYSFVRTWIRDNYDYPVYVGDTDGEFNRGRARNAAAAAAGDWDVGIFHDADTIAHPQAVEEAIDLALITGKMVVAADAYMYTSEGSTNRILSSGSPAFARPVSLDGGGIIARPCSGVVVVTRELYDAVGGYIETFDGWGFEDLIFLTSCGIWGNGNTWVSDHILIHLWHSPAVKDARTEANERHWRQLVALQGDADRAAAFLRGLGHTVGAP